MNNEELLIEIKRMRLEQRMHFEIVMAGILGANTDLTEEKILAVVKEFAERTERDADRKAR